jgi:nitronate monooxygenase
MATPTLPSIIQGGMGIGVSGWPLARAVAAEGHLGVVSGTAIDAILARRLQDGDADGAMRRALAALPWPDIATRILDAYFIPGGRPATRPYKATPIAEAKLSQASIELIVAANFVEVFLAKEGHDGVVGINYLQKIQLPTLPSMLGAMAAGVDVVLMGAGIPMNIPGTLDRLARWEPVDLILSVEHEGEHHVHTQHLDPLDVAPGPPPGLRRPLFFAIIASDTVARTLVRKANGEVDGFIVEGHTAGGHNAPPRGKASHFGPRDIPNIERIRKLDRPFWLAGGWASPERLAEALELGAAGIQVGTAFAFCDESGTTPDLKRAVIERCVAGTLDVVTDFEASPTGYPFKLAQIPGSTSDPEVRHARRRVCDLGYLRHVYCTGENEVVSSRCPGEPEAAFVKKGGHIEDTRHKQCLCNGLLATVGLGQVRGGKPEPPMVTAGDDFEFLPHVLPPKAKTYRARDVLAYLTS